MSGISNSEKVIPIRASGFAGSVAVNQYITPDELFERFRINFEEALKTSLAPSAEIEHSDNPKCNIVEVFANDTLSSSDWYCENNDNVRTYTYRFSENGKNYSVQAWLRKSQGYAFNLYENSKLVASVSEDAVKTLMNPSTSFMANGQSRDYMEVLNRGLKLATNFDVCICMDDSAMFYCNDLVTIYGDNQ